MNKKLKDLTLLEIAQICSEHMCEDCPLNVFREHYPDARGICYMQVRYVMDNQKVQNTEVEITEEKDEV